MALVEALVATSLLGMGLLGATRLVVHALDAARQTRLQEHAQALAHDTLDCAMARATPCPPADAVTWQGVAFTVELQTIPLQPHRTDITIQVRWQTGTHRSAPPGRLTVRTQVSDLPDWVGVSSP